MYTGRVCHDIVGITPALVHIPTPFQIVVRIFVYTKTQQLHVTECITTLHK